MAPHFSTTVVRVTRVRVCAVNSLPVTVRWMYIVFNVHGIIHNKLQFLKILPQIRSQWIWPLTSQIKSFYPGGQLCQQSQHSSDILITRIKSVTVDSTEQRTAQSSHLSKDIWQQEHLRKVSAKLQQPTGWNLSSSHSPSQLTALLCCSTRPSRTLQRPLRLSRCHSK